MMLAFRLVSTMDTVSWSRASVCASLCYMDLPYTDTNYKEVLKKMERAGKITANPPHGARRKIKGEVTFADDVTVTFPSKRE